MTDRKVSDMDQEIYAVAIKVRSLGWLFCHVTNDNDETDNQLYGCGLLLQELADSLMSVLERDKCRK